MIDSSPGAFSDFSDSLEEDEVDELSDSTIVGIILFEANEFLLGEFGLNVSVGTRISLCVFYRNFFPVGFFLNFFMADY